MQDINFDRVGEELFEVQVDGISATIDSINSRTVGDEYHRCRCTAPPLDRSGIGVDLERRRVTERSAMSIAGVHLARSPDNALVSMIKPNGMTGGQIAGHEDRVATGVKRVDDFGICPGGEQYRRGSNQRDTCFHETSH